MTTIVRIFIMVIVITIATARITNRLLLFLFSLVLYPARPAVQKLLGRQDVQRSAEHLPGTWPAAKPSRRERFQGIVVWCLGV